MSQEFTVNASNRVKRGEFIAVAEWSTTSGQTTTEHRQVLGAYTESSALEFNADVQKTTDILDITRTDVNKTQPQQSFDPLYIDKQSDFANYLAGAALDNDTSKYNGAFNVYLISAWEGTSSAIPTRKHRNCTILPTSLGGDGGSYLSMPIEVHFSNDIVKGTIDKLEDDFTFTATT